LNFTHVPPRLSRSPRSSAIEILVKRCYIERHVYIDVTHRWYNKITLNNSLTDISFHNNTLYIHCIFQYAIELNIDLISKYKIVVSTGFTLRTASAESYMFS